MITLHESNITSFPLDNGIGVLSDAIRAYAEEELNGMFEFYMEYDSEGHLVDELKEERIIKAKAQDKLGYQLFRIYSITKNHENDNIIVHAQHITYDLANNFVEKMESRSLTKKQVMEKIGSSTVLPHTFNVTSSNTTTVSSTSLYRTNPLQMIAGMEGSVLQIWGGQIERDNFNLILHDRRGHDDGVTVTYEKNITGLDATFDISGLVTRIFPFVFIEATDDSPERLITVSGKYIDSPHINDYEVIRTEPIDYSSDERIDTQDKTNAQIRQQLTKVAKDYFKETGNDKIKVEMDVQFAHLWGTEEYKDVKVLELVGMGDTVTINHSKLNVDATAIVNYIKYDCIAQVNEEVKLGSVKARLTDSINKIDSIEKKVEQAESHANQAIISANGKNTTFYGPDEPVEGMKKGDLWFKVIDGQYHKTYRYDGIDWKEILDMDSQEAKEEARQAQERADEAVNRANQATQTANTAIGQAQAGFDLAQESLGIASDAFEEIEPIKTTINEHSGEITTIKESAIGMQEQITGLYGDVTTLQKSSSRLSARIEKLDIRGYNFITHLPKLWEMGFYGIDGVDNMVPGSKYDSEQLIRLADKYRLEPNTDYVLSDHPEMAEDGQEYIETNLFLHLWNDDGSYSRYLVLNFRNEEHFITFKTSSTETQFSLHVMPTKEENKLNPHMIHEVFHYKLALGTERSGWTPNLDDTGELASDVQHFVTEFEATAESLAGRISDNEGNLTTLTATVDGLQTTVSDVQGNVSNLTQLSTTLQSRLSDAEGNINELTLTSKSLSSRLESLGNPNLIVTSDFEHGTFNASTGEPMQTPYTNRLRSINFIDVLDTSRFVASMQGVQQDISINFYQYDENYEYISHTGFKSFVEGKFDYIPPDRVKFFKMSIRFNDNRDIHIQDIIEAKIKLEAGDIITDYDRSYTSYAQISKLSDNINLRVAKGDVINQINLDTSGVLISGKKLILDGDTTVLGTFKLDGSAHIKDASIGTAQIGTIDGAIANIINLSANSIVGGILSSQNDNMTLNLNTGRLHMQRASFTLGSGADIEFLDPGNKIVYQRLDSEDGFNRTAGIGISNALNRRFPVIFMGTVGTGKSGFSMRDDNYFTGFIANTNKREAIDGIGNSVVGYTFHVREKPLSYDKGFTFELRGNPTLRGMNAHNYDYYLGNSDFLFHRLFVRGINTVGNFVIRNVVNTGIGWRLSTIQESGRVSLRGINGGSYNYDLGASESYNHFHFGYINNLRGSGSSSVGSSSNPYTYGHIDTFTVHKNFWNNSLREYKENIVDLNLETAIEFVRDNNVKVFNYKGSDIKTVGLIRDDLVGDVSLVATETAISPTSVQYINQKVLQHVLKETDDIKDEVNRLKIENQYLKQKVKQLEEMVA